MKLAYKAVDKAGRVSTNIIEAADTAEASDKLRQQGLFVTEISESDGSISTNCRPSSPIDNGKLRPERWRVPRRSFMPCAS